jgi:large subunit ribosomal protein L4
VSGSGRKPWRQKGTGRARVGSIRTPLWRKGGTVFGPQPRSYDYALPKKVERGALKAALTARLHDGAVTVIDELRADERKTKPVAGLLKTLGATGKTLIVDVALDENFARSARNIAGVRLVASGQLTARDVMDTSRIVMTRAAIERLQEVLE